MARIGVVGAGSWGTALAVHLARAGHEVRLWARREELARAMAAERVNREYLPDVEIPGGVGPTADLSELAGCRHVLLVVPSHGFRGALGRLLESTPGGEPLDLVSATKGIEPESLARMSEVTSQESRRAGRSTRFAVLSGPSFAVELAAGQPTAAVIASRDGSLASELQGLIADRTFRLYTSSDVSGVELGGSSKNVIAIAAGVVAGLGLGHNTLAALITRGLHEITRLGVASGGHPRTFSGLAGLGDLVLTCTGGLSRNRRTGLELARGKSLEEISAGTSMVAEGVRNSVAIQQLARRAGVEMPIIDQMVAVLYQGKPVRQAIDELMTRELKAEAEL